MFYIIVDWIPVRECHILYSHLFNCRNIFLIPGKSTSEGTVFSAEYNPRSVHIVTCLSTSTTTIITKNDVHNLHVIMQAMGILFSCNWFNACLVKLLFPSYILSLLFDMRPYPPTFIELQLTLMRGKFHISETGMIYNDDFEIHEPYTTNSNTLVIPTLHNFSIHIITM